MAKTMILIILCAVIPLNLVQGGEKPPTWIPTPAERADRPWIPGPGEVTIFRYSVSVPLGRVLLARNGREFLALKFTNTWLGKGEEEHYTSYDFYYQSDGSGDFSKGNVESGSGEVFFPGLRMIMGMYVAKGDIKDKIRFGKIELKWNYIANIGFPKRSKGELAPTPWTSIDEVNVYDPRIKWYRGDRNRKARTVSIDQLWRE